MELNDLTIGLTAILAIGIGIFIYVITSERTPLANSVNNKSNQVPKISNKSPTKFGAAPRCALCDTSVYPAEKVQAINRIWHKHCFKCGGTSNDGGCGKVLTLDKYLSHGDDPFCQPCHTKLFGNKGFVK